MLVPQHVLRIAFVVAALAGLTIASSSGTAPWTQALLLVWDSDVMAVLATAVFVSVYVVLGAAQRRAITPGLPMLACARVGALDALRAHRSLNQPGPRGRSKAGDLGNDTHRDTALTSSAAALWISRAVGVMSLSIGAVVVLGGFGHLPRAGTASGTAVLVATGWLALVGAVWGLHLGRRMRGLPFTKATRAVLARRGPHALVVAVGGEVALGLAVALVAVVLTHTTGGAAPGVPEVIATAVLARLFTLAPFPPLGLGLADAILVFGLTWVNVPMGVAIATTLVWRVTGLAVIAVALASVRSRQPNLVSAGQLAVKPTDSRLGRLVHRTWFALLALLPRRVAGWARRRLFDAMFGMADDPWDYAGMPYEQGKQAQLAAAIPSGALVIVEVGCADGHNLAMLARLHPGSKVVGIDISERAVATSTRRVRDQPNAMVVRADARSVADALHEFRGKVDVLVLSEVLYYLGTDRQVQRALTPTRALLGPAAAVVLVHGAYDAQRLHVPACAALGVVPVADTLVDDHDRPYNVTVAVLPAEVPSAAASPM